MTTVLVVDDNELNQELAGEILKSFGARVSVADNGASALDRLAGQHFDCVLMDVQMPVMGGIEATESIRRWEREENRTRLPIVALTAAAFEEHRQRCEAAGMDAFLTKPIDFDELVSMLGQWMAPAGGER